VDSLMPVDQVMDVIALFVEQFPSIELDISEEVLGGAWEALIDDRVQLVVGAPEPKPSGHNIQTSPIGTLQRVFAVSANHPLASVRQPLVSVDIEPYPMVVVHDSSRSAIPRNTRVINDDMHFYVQTITQKLAAQKAGIGVGFLPSRIVEPYLQSGAMVVLEVDEVGLKDHLFLAWKAANRGPGVKALLKLFRETEFVI